MLKRKMIGTLRDWRQHKGRECLFVRGARQVGKSYIVDLFGKTDYSSFISIDFIKQPQMKAAFEGSLEPEEIYMQLSLLIPGARFIKGDTLIFLDEIQDCPQARSALKYLAQDGRYDVIASGSLLGIQYLTAQGDSSVPVGYERPIVMRPLDFEEFLWAKGYDDGAIGNLKACFDGYRTVPWPAHEKMMRLLREYIAVGGMPAVVQAYVDTGNFNDVHDEQALLLANYLDDIAKYAAPAERVKARACFESLPRQLAKENTKFQYSVVEKRGTARKFEGSVDWLAGAEMVIRCQAVSVLSYPLASYEDEGKFRLYANDTGILMAMFDYDMKDAVVNNTLTGPMKGGLYENLAACMLAGNGVPARYWMSKSGNREIEFLLDGPGSVVPVEVKAGRNASVSLDEVLGRDDVELGYKLVSGNVGRSGKKVTLPLYMAMFI